MEGLYAEYGRLEFLHRKRMRELSDEREETRKKLGALSQKMSKLGEDIDHARRSVLPMVPIARDEIPIITTPLEEASAALETFYASVEKRKACNAEKEELVKQHNAIANEQNKLASIYEKERERLTALLHEKAHQ